MSRQRLPTTGAGRFALAVGALAAVVLLNLLLVVNGDTGYGASSDDTGRNDVATMHLYAEPGRIIRIGPMWGYNGPVAEYVSFYVVEGGEAEAFLRNGTPEHVYFQAGPPLPIHTFEIRRPTPPPGKEHHVVPGWHPPVDEYDAVDLVWVLDLESVPPESRSYILSAFREGPFTGPHASIVLLRGWIYDLQPFFYALEALLALVAAVTLVHWIGTRRKRETPDPGLHATLADVALQADTYVANLRRLMLLNGLLLALMGVFGLHSANLLMEEASKPSGDWSLWMMGALWAVFFGLVGLWATAYRRVHRESHRLRRRLDEAPFGE